MTTRPGDPSRAQLRITAARHALREGFQQPGPYRLRLLRDLWNVVFEARTRRGRFLLRLHSADFHERSGVEAELQWLEALRKHPAVRAPRPAAAAWTGALPGFGVRTCTLLTWTHGRRVARIGQGTGEALGEAMAELHTHTASWAPAATLPRPRWDVASMQRYFFRPHDRRGWRGLPDGVPARFRRVFRAAARAEERLAERWPEGFGLVHADLHRGNLIHSRRGLALIDFDDCGHACHLYDLAIPLASQGVLSDSKLGRALLMGYQRRRPLPEYALESLDRYVLARAATVPLFVQGVSQERPSYRRHVGRLLEVFGALERLAAAPRDVL